MKKSFSLFSHLQNDFPAGLVVFLVAVPLCLGIALASGAPLFSGIISGIVGGVIVSLLSKSPLGVSGPAAGLVVIVISAIQELGSFELFLYAVVIAGLFQIIFGIVKAGIIGYYFPSSVIKGMLTGIGIIIFLKQLPHAVGYDMDPEGDWEFFQFDGHNTLSDLYYMMGFISPGALVIALLSLGILILWERPVFGKHAFFRLVQGPLVVVILGIILASVFKGSALFEIQADHMVSVPVAGSLSGFFSQFSAPDFSQWMNPRVYVIAFTLAVVASLETLLCVEATDKLDPEKRITPTNRELFAQGAGNIVSGLIGGLPITQVIVRSSANIQSGGKTRMSALFHGILLLLSALAIPHVLNLIPFASLAAILLMVGYKLAKPSLFADMYRRGKAQFVLFIVTVFGIVFTDLLIGIGLGLCVGIMQILWNNYKTPYHFDYHDYKEGEPVKIELSEDVSFLNKASIMQTLDHMPDGAQVIINASRAKNIHPDVVEIIEDFQVKASNREISVILQGFSNRDNHHPFEKLRTTVSSGGKLR